MSEATMPEATMPGLSPELRAMLIELSGRGIVEELMPGGGYVTQTMLQTLREICGLIYNDDFPFFALLNETNPVVFNRNRYPILNLGFVNELVHHQDAWDWLEENANTCNVESCALLRLLCWSIFWTKTQGVDSPTW